MDEVFVVAYFSVCYVHEHAIRCQGLPVRVLVPGVNALIINTLDLMITSISFCRRTKHTLVDWLCFINRNNIAMTRILELFRQINMAAYIFAIRYIRNIGSRKRRIRLNLKSCTFQYSIFSEQKFTPLTGTCIVKSVW